MAKERNKEGRVEDAANVDFHVVIDAEFRHHLGL